MRMNRGPLVGELRGIDWYGEVPLQSYCPNPREPFQFEVNLSVGALGEAGADIFIVTVCNPSSLEQECRAEKIVVGTARLIVNEFVYEEFEKFVRQYCAKCVGKDWDTVALRVARLGRWEFEDYNMG